MRILIVSPAFPYPPSSGFTTRVYQFARLLGRRHQVTLLSYASSGDLAHLPALEAVCEEVHTVPRAQDGTANKRWAQLAAMLSPTSYQRRSQHTPQMQQKLDELAARGRYDVIQVETSQMLATFDYDSRSAIALTEHDLVYELLYRMYETESSLARRAYNWLEYVKFKRDEIGTWREADLVVTTSVREERIVKEIVPAARVLVAPNGVDVDYFEPSTEAPDENAIVMTGFMKTRPNIDAALYFVEKILPAIVASRPNMVFYLVGGGAPDEITRLAGRHVVVTNDVPDVRPYVYKAAVFVVPLRMGGGTRLKVLEALSMKKPLVSTSLGCEGIDVKDREHLLIADEPEAFARAVIELLDNKATALRLAASGYELIRRQYQWQAVVDRVETSYEDLHQARLRGGRA